jgi:hypothetical protein
MGVYWWYWRRVPLERMLVLRMGPRWYWGGEWLVFCGGVLGMMGGFAFVFVLVMSECGR